MKPLATYLKDHSVCVLGLGYVGLTLAVAMADAGFRVHGVEVRKSVLKQLENGTAHFFEPRLNEKLQHAVNAGRFSFSSEVRGSFTPTVYIITVGTPLNTDKKVSLESHVHQGRWLNNCRTAIL